MPNRETDDRCWYEGTSGYLRWGPKFFLFMAGFMFLVHWNHWFQFSATFCSIAFIHNRWLPWRFEIEDDGVQLVFPFGRRLYFSRSVAAIRIEVVGATVFDTRRSKFRLGYPLMDGLLFHPGRETLLRSAFVERGFTVT
jgi:hypothetical protein